jgi:hypothetical protein
MRRPSQSLARLASLLLYNMKVLKVGRRGRWTIWVIRALPGGKGTLWRATDDGGEWTYENANQSQDSASAESLREQDADTAFARGT